MQATVSLDEVERGAREFRALPSHDQEPPVGSAGAPTRISPRSQPRPSEIPVETAWSPGPRARPKYATDRRSSTLAPRGGSWPRRDERRRHAVQSDRSAPSRCASNARIRRPGSLLAVPRDLARHLTPLPGPAGACPVVETTPPDRVAGYLPCKAWIVIPCAPGNGPRRTSDIDCVPPPALYRSFAELGINTY